jgi:hypothetical protein
MNTLKDIHIDNLGQNNLPKNAIDALINKSYFKLFIPKALGGLELSLVEACNVLTETSYINPSLGWVHNLGAGANFFCGFFDKETAEEIFLNEKAITSGSGRPSGTFRDNGNHYILNGTWNKCSGANFATHLTCVAKNISNPKEIKTFILPSSNISLKDDWSTFGLKASSSYSYTLKDFKVKNSFEFEINKVKSFELYPIYHIPFELFARLCFSATFEGIALRFADDIKKEIRKPNNQLLEAAKRLKEVINNINDLRSKLAKKLFENSIQNKKEYYTHDFLLLSTLHKTAYKEAAEIFFHAGVRVTEEESPANWSYRDFCTAIQHYMLK